MRSPPLITDEYYHICNKSIAGFQIFNDDSEFGRMKEALRFSKPVYQRIPLCQLLNSKTPQVNKVRESIGVAPCLVRIIAYCLMPTHIHLVLQQKKNNGISSFMSRVQNGYARYFNLRHGRKGPLWEGRFERILIENSEHLLHETRYVHLNPVTAYLTEHPAEWSHSSFREYVDREEKEEGLCDFEDLVEMPPPLYEKFVMADKENQRGRAGLKKKTNRHFNLRG